MHPPAEKMSELVAALCWQFGTALQFAEVANGLPEPVALASSYYEAELDLPTAAAEVGFTADQFRAKVEKSSPELKRIFTVLQNDGGRIHRQAFVEAFPQLVQEWELGEHYRSHKNQPSKDEAPKNPTSYPPSAEEGQKKREPLSQAVLLGVGIPGLLVVILGITWLARRVRAKSDAWSTAPPELNDE
jgi:hypothetical protein